MNICGKTIKNLRRRTGKPGERLFKVCIKPKSYIEKKKFDNDLVAIHKIKTILTFKKPAYVRMCILELSTVPMYEFHYDYINPISTNVKLT